MDGGSAAPTSRLRSRSVGTAGKAGGEGRPLFPSPASAGAGAGAGAAATTGVRGRGGVGGQTPAQAAARRHDDEMRECTFQPALNRSYGAAQPVKSRCARSRAHSPWVAADFTTGHQRLPPPSSFPPFPHCAQVPVDEALAEPAAGGPRVHVCAARESAARVDGRRLSSRCRRRRRL